MRLYIGGQEVIYPARWYFCDPQAQLFPNPHGAESSAWLKQYETNLEWGEDGTQTKWDRGVNPGYPGLCSVGDPQWFVDGQLPADFLSGPLPEVPACCGYLPAPNPDPRCPPVPGVPCAFCDSGYAPTSFKIIASQGSGVWETCNGSYTLVHVAGLFWEIALEPAGYWIIIPQGGALVLQTSPVSAFIYVVNYILPDKFDCYNPSITFPSTGFYPGLGNTPTVTMLPNS